ncbi:hypothetical protein CAL12_14900 [Bordetella genomosp. 8]|uniref:Quinol:cytochrome c oxidoreductase quinone-binding subunit 2 n=2 Tax=Bordetella genomosp. 8 TaxID=1416806 RepID=A0A1W6YLJ2_9BORD|nr:hypothetical protein CAL12_14900 [Bordetella genomosp. 8]
MQSIKRQGVAPLAAGAVLLAVAALGALLDARGFLAAWLAAWWFWAGLALGAQATLWLHRLTGGNWIAPVGAALNALRAALPAVGLLVLPVLVWQQPLYPWARADWVDTAKEPAFRQLWFSSPGMALRVIACVVLWSVLARVDGAGSKSSRRQGYAAAGLIAYAFTISLVAVDLLMSLTPAWYSTAFGFVVLVAQLKAAMAAGAWAGARHAPAPLRGDLGNLLMMYVLTWTYLAFTQFQIIWAENLPAEISWYVARQGGWAWMAILLAVFGFAVPLVVLLFRTFKRSAVCLRALAALLLAASACETVWWVFPSAGAASKGHPPDGPVSWHAAWMLLLLIAGMGLIVRAAAVLFPTVIHGAAPDAREQAHA